MTIIQALFACFGAQDVTIVKTDDETKVTDTAIADDGELAFTTVAGHTYRIDVGIRWFARAAPQIKWAFSHSGTTALFLGDVRRGDLSPPAAPSDGEFIQALLASDIGSTPTEFTQAGSDTTTDRGSITLTALLVVGASGGTFGFQWAQNTSDANPATVYAGSWMRFRGIG